jgi:hypothetical protein
VKKIITLFIFFLGCRTFETVPVYDHQVIKQFKVENPSFALQIENDQNDYYLNEVEDAFIKNKISLFYEDRQVINSESEGKGVGVGFVGNKIGIAVGKEKGTARTTIQNTENTRATFVYILDCYNWTFKVVSANTRELLVKGRIKYSWEQEVTMMIRELIGQ